MKEINLQEYFDLGLGTKAQLCNWKEKNRQKLLNPKVKLSMKNRAEKNGYSLLIDDQRSLNSGRKKSQVRQDIETLTFYMLVNRMVSGKQGEYLSMSKWVPELLFTKNDISPYSYNPEEIILKSYNINKEDAKRIQQQLFGYIKNHLRNTFTDLVGKQILLQMEKLVVLERITIGEDTLNNFIEIDPISTQSLWDEVGKMLTRNGCYKRLNQLQKSQKYLESNILEVLNGFGFYILKNNANFFCTINDKVSERYRFIKDRYRQEYDNAREDVYMDEEFTNTKKMELIEFLSNDENITGLFCLDKGLDIIAKYSKVDKTGISKFWSTYSYTLKTGSARLETYFLKQRKTLSHKRAQEEFIKYYSEYKKLIKKLDIEYSKYLILDNIERISKKADIDLI